MPGCVAFNAGVVDQSFIAMLGSNAKSPARAGLISFGDGVGSRL